ncbi:FTR1 family protein, partial [Candidatus Micrarchaeota archaeon]|nr:FTR1 family protein [Candidatus Micrarchaeota archaeon]
MLPEFLITFRESLEAALVVGIVLAYLEKTQNTQYNRHVYLGIITAVVASIIVAFSFEAFAGGFEGTAEQL